MSLDVHMASIVSSEGLNVIWLLTVTLLVVTTILFWRTKHSEAEKKSGTSSIRNDAPGTVANGHGSVTQQSVENNIPLTLGEVSVSKILIHPIKSCKGLSLSQSRFTPQGLEHDRKWCIMDANTHTIVTAREVSKMVLIEPRVEYNPSDSYGGRLVVKVPQTSGDVTFSVPLDPTPELLKEWSVLDDCNLFKVVYMDGYICQSLSPSEPDPTEVLSEYFGQRVYLMMKGPIPRECAPTKSFPDLKATAEYHDGYPILFASEESLHDVSKSIRLAADGENSPIGRIGGMNQDRWKDNDVEIERFRPNIVFEGAGHPWVEDMWRSVGHQSSP
ncbi:hypothetical protein QCA50_010150 [Cerrena zonata]|uniref:MOSC domain-containing protein n=1 Tax=Cerrena zonata TaxID=2478898 RepID=A0AAW0FZB3_9APHY